MSIYNAPTLLLNAKEFQKALADQKAFTTLMGQVFGRDTAVSETQTKKADMLRELINNYLPGFLSIPKEVAADAVREMLVKMWELSQVSGKRPDRKEVLFSLEESLSPGQMALHDKFMQIFKSKNLISLYEEKMSGKKMNGEQMSKEEVAKRVDIQIQFLAYLLVKQAGALTEGGRPLSQDEFEGLALNVVTGVPLMLDKIKEKSSAAKAAEAAYKEMQNQGPSASGRKKSAKDFLSIGTDKSGLVSDKAKEIIKDAITEAYAYVKIFQEYSSKAADELKKNIFAGPKPASPPFTPSGKEALRDLFWATVNIEKDENTQRDNEVKKKHGYRKTG